jgi:ABC-type amino acid transport substrate-binding protein
MVRSIATLLAALGLAASAVSAPAQAASDSPILSRIVSSGTLRVGMSGGQPPLNFKSRDGKLLGLEVDMAGALAGLMGLELKIVQKPFSELLGALAGGEVDLVISGMTITPERNMKAAFVGPYFLSGKSILTRSTSLAQVDEIGDLDQADLRPGPGRPRVRRPRGLHQPAVRPVQAPQGVAGDDPRLRRSREAPARRRGERAGRRP